MCVCVCVCVCVRACVCVFIQVFRHEGVTQDQLVKQSFSLFRDWLPEQN